MQSGCEASDPPTTATADCIIQLPSSGESEDLITLATQSLARQDQAIRVYVETPERQDDPKTEQAEDLDYSDLCRPPVEGDSLSFGLDGSPPRSDNPVVWFRAITGKPSDWDPASSSLCFTASKRGSIRPLSMMADDLRRAAAEDSENFDPSMPSAFPKITLIIPSRCRVDSSVKCPDGTTAGGPLALKAFLDSTVRKGLVGSEVFQKDGAAVVAWDRPAAGAKPTDPVGALVLSPFAKTGGSNTKSYDTFGLTATAERRMGIAGGLGQPALLGLSAAATPLGSDVFPKR